jgi:DNA polymerase I-like protein with 3'-5' exonuclease and polymerase domains
VKVHEIGSGNKLIVADYSQIELRVFAQISGDQKMIDEYQRGQDSQGLTASKFLTGWRMMRLQFSKKP